MTKGSLRFFLLVYRLRCVRRQCHLSLPCRPSHSRFGMAPAPESFSRVCVSSFRRFRWNVSACLLLPWGVSAVPCMPFRRKVYHDVSFKVDGICRARFLADDEAFLMKGTFHEKAVSSLKISFRRLTASVWDCGLSPDRSTRSGRFTLKILQSRSRSAVAGWTFDETDAVCSGRWFRHERL